MELSAATAVAVAATGAIVLQIVNTIDKVLLRFAHIHTFLYT